MAFDLDLTQAQPLLARARSVFGAMAADEILMAAGRRVGVKAEDVIQERLYPPASGKALPVYYTRTRKRDGKPYRSKFKSLAQQRKVMALVAAGKIPYRRSGQLGRSITSEPRIVAVGVVMVRAGSNLEYAPYVIDREMQSFYHRDNWSTVQDDVERAVPELSAVAVKTVVQEINRRLSHG
jgi:hypothetical protein